MFVKRDEPENVDYKSVVTQADLLFNVYISQMGVYSSSRRSTYEPTVFVTFCVVAKQLGPECAVEEEVKFGDNATKEVPFEHVVPAEFHWKSADSLFQNVPGVITSVKLGLSIAAKEIAMTAISKDRQAKIAPMETFAIGEVVTDESVVRKDTAVEMENPARLSNASKKNSASDSVDVAKKLRDLKALRDDNVITEEEFQTKRKALVEVL